MTTLYMIDYTILIGVFMAHSHQGDREIQV